MKDKIPSIKLVYEPEHYNERARCTVPACWTGRLQKSQMSRVVAGSTREEAEQYLKEMFGAEVEITTE